MRTAIRITKHREGNYDFLEFQILDTTRSRRFLRTVGTIRWQGDDRNGWYGLRYIANTDATEHKNLLTLYKLASYIEDRAVWNSTPAEVFALIGGEEYFYVQGEWIPYTDNGKQLFHVVKNSTGTRQTLITSANETMAQRAIEGMIKRNELANEPHHAESFGTRLALAPVNLDHIATDRPISVNKSNHN